MTFEDKQTYVLKELIKLEAFEFYEPFSENDFIHKIENIISPKDFINIEKQLRQDGYIAMTNDSPQRIFITSNGIKWIEEKEKNKRFNWATFAIIFGGVAGGCYYALEILLKILKSILHCH